MFNTSRGLASTLCLTLVSAMPLIAQEPDAEITFAACLGEAATAEHRKECYEPFMVAMIQDLRGLPLSMVDLGREMAATIQVCLAARSQLSPEDSELCYGEVRETHARIQTKALDALPPAVKEQLSDLQASYDACIDEVYAEHEELTEEGYGACVEQRSIGALQAVTTASETWKCYDMVARDRSDPLVVLNGSLRMDSDNPNVGPGTVQLLGLVEHDARFGIAGLNRRWDFSVDEGAYDFAIVIEPNGDGSYYDFSAVPSGERTRPQQRYSCERAGRE